MDNAHKDNAKDTVYEPQEDSFLFAEYVKKYAFGKVLDMGCGSGILGIKALSNKRVESVYFSDINPKALEYTKEHLPGDNSKDAFFIRSNLFESIRDKDFDVIVFNPPYLPDDEFDEEKLITTGGKTGHELIEKFLKNAKGFLSDDGIILLLFSSLTGKSDVDRIIKENNYLKEQLAKKGLFMEQLYIYKIRARADKELYRGHRGIVIKEKIGDKLIAIKKPLSKAYNPGKEAKFLKILNENNIGPKLLSFKNDEIVMEFIEGKRIIEYLGDTNTSKKDMLRIIKNILEQLSRMDGLRINKLELTHPYKHIIIDDKTNQPIMIDFERCIYSDKPKNITQFIQFLCSERLKHIFDAKNVIIGRSALRNLAKNHKSNNSDKIVEDILGLIS